MALDEVGYRSADLAREIRRQLKAPDGYVDVEQIAYSLDIIEIKLAPLTSFEGALFTDAERSCGAILANSSKGKQRSRFTIAHELLHFLNDTHVQTADGFQCGSSDIGQSKVSSTAGSPRHLRQETEANRFAIELLAPEASFEPFLSTPPDLTHVRNTAMRLELSKEVAARRYRDLHDANIAMVFFQSGTVRYFEKSDDFPFLMAQKNSLMPPSVETCLPAGTLTDVEGADPRDWLDGPCKGELWVQTLHQQDGFGITMLTLDSEDPDDGGPEDAFDRYSRWG